MPEGHTLHRLARDLDDAFAGRTVAATSPQGRFTDGAAALDGSRFLEASAHGKHLFVTFGRGRARLLLHVHLGLYGAFTLTRLARGGRPAPPVGQVRLRLAATGVVADLRGPTRCELLDPDAHEALLERLGPDPLQRGADGDEAYARIARSAAPLAVLLMRQDVLAGVGNVYRAEVLFRHGVDPMLPGREVPPGLWRALWDDLTELMAEGVRLGRIDTVRSEHLPEAMDRAPRQDRHGGEVYVYRRAGEPCLLCGTPIATRVIEGRNLYWCPGCQSGR
jgi:formamidopyrimidine-DNA glycosylase